MIRVENPTKFIFHVGASRIDAKAQTDLPDGVLTQGRVVSLARRGVEFLGNVVDGKLKSFAADDRVVLWLAGTPKPAPAPEVEPEPAAAPEHEPAVEPEPEPEPAPEQEDPWSEKPNAAAPLYNEDDLVGLKNAELIEILKDLGLDTTGKKSELIDRILEG